MLRFSPSRFVCSGTSSLLRSAKTTTRIIMSSSKTDVRNNNCMSSFSVVSSSWCQKNSFASFRAPPSQNPTRESPVKESSPSSPSTSSSSSPSQQQRNVSNQQQQNSNSATQKNSSDENENVVQNKNQNAYDEEDSAAEYYARQHLLKQKHQQQDGFDSDAEHVDLEMKRRVSPLEQPHKLSDPLTRPPPKAPFPHPQELVEAVLEFVRQAKDLPPADENIPMLGKKEETAIARMDSILFYEGYVPDTEKFRVVRSLVYFDSVRMNTKYLLPALHEILRLLVPGTIYQVLRDVDIDEKFYFQERETMETIEEFFGTVIEGKATDEEYTQMFLDIQKRVKPLAGLDSFKKFVREFDQLLLQSQTAANVTEACLEFDPHGIGRIKAYEMRLALQKAIPSENFGEEEGKRLKDDIIDEIMLEVAEQTEEDGYVAYQQLRKS